MLGFKCFPVPESTTSSMVSSRGCDACGLTGKHQIVYHRWVCEGLPNLLKPRTTLNQNLMLLFGGSFNQIEGSWRVLVLAYPAARKDQPATQESHPNGAYDSYLEYPWAVMTKSAQLLKVRRFCSACHGEGNLKGGRGRKLLEPAGLQRGLIEVWRGSVVRPASAAN